MPRTAHARDKNPRAKSVEAYRAKVAHFAFQMGPPLDEAIDFVQALQLMGFGMMGAVGEGDERAIVTVANTASKRLEVLQEARRGIMKAVRKRRPPKR
jgi:hypothetical protein